MALTIWFSLLSEGGRVCGFYRTDILANSLFFVVRASSLESWPRVYGCVRVSNVLFGEVGMLTAY